MPDTLPTAVALPQNASYRPALVGWRAPGGSWSTAPFDENRPEIAIERHEPDDRITIVVHRPGAAAVELAFPVPARFQAFGGGERFETLDLKGQSVRYYLENFGLGNGTYLPSPWIATTLGYALFLADEAPAMFHIAAPFDPDMLRVQVEGDRLAVEIHRGTLPELYDALIRRIGPPLMPDDDFFGLWKAGDWRIENATTVAADRAGHADLGLPLTIKLIDAYWSSEVHSFAFDTAKYPDAWRMVGDMAAEGTGIYLWLCPWVVVGTRSFEEAKAKGYIIVDNAGNLITRRPGANPNVVAALIDYSYAPARAWWSGHLRSLLKKGIRGFKVDFGEQLPEHAVLRSGETGGRAHNAFVRHYLEATIEAFDGAVPAIISRSGSPRVRTPIWSGDQTSDFCPKTGLPSAIRGAQSAALSGWSFVGSDLGGYFGTPTAQVFARWAQFSCFTPLMMLHGLGCREPWDMGPDSLATYDTYAKFHLALLPLFQHYGRIASRGGPPLLRMMPLAFPEIDWSTINDWDQQYMLGDDLLVAPVAFYGNTRAIYVPSGEWYDVLAQTWVTGPAWRVHDVPIHAVPLFVRHGATLTLALDGRQKRAAQLVFARSAATSAAADSGNWEVVAVGHVGTGHQTAAPASVASKDMEIWFGGDIAWSSPARNGAEVRPPDA